MHSSPPQAENFLHNIGLAQWLFQNLQDLHHISGFQSLHCNSPPQLFQQQSGQGSDISCTIVPAEDKHCHIRILSKLVNLSSEQCCSEPAKSNCSKMFTLNIRKKILTTQKEFHFWGCFFLSLFLSFPVLSLAESFYIFLTTVKFSRKILRNFFSLQFRESALTSNYLCVIINHQCFLLKYK